MIRQKQIRNSFLPLRLSVACWTNTRFAIVPSGPIADASGACLPLLFLSHVVADIAQLHIYKHRRTSLLVLEDSGATS
ncbi:hypothetical protein ACN47E_003455 [Coniothyrium glycines]